MIDLHSHTTYSDGTDTVKELLHKAENAELEFFSITDHNTVDAYFDSSITNSSSIFSGVIIPGVEITTTYKGEIIEILGYGFNLNQMKAGLAQHVLTFEEKQTREFELVKKKYKDAGIKFDESNISFDPKVSSCRKAFWKEITKYEENTNKLSYTTSMQSSSKFTRQEVYNPESEYYVDQSELYPSFKNVIDLIHKCGGIAFLAHLYVYAHAQNLERNLIDIISEFQLDGIECYYSSFTDSQSKYLEEICIQNNILRCGGSDYHGLRKPDISIGAGEGCLVVPRDIFKSWPSYITSNFL